MLLDDIVFYIDICDVLNLTFVVNEHDRIRLAVVNGQRPDLSIITGPETLTPLAVDWISRCWHQTPDNRPTFAGIYYQGLLQKLLKLMFH